MSCPQGNRLALDLAEAKNASVLIDTHSSEDEVPLRVREEERGGWGRPKACRNPNGIRGTQINVSDLPSR
jgi:hypothetical protein